MADDRTTIYEDEENRRYLWEQGPENDRTVRVRMGILCLDMTRDDANQLLQMLLKWKAHNPGYGWDDDPLTIQKSKAAVTCVKPSGPPIQSLTDQPEGIHPPFPRNYQRKVRKNHGEEEEGRGHARLEDGSTHS